MGFISGVIVRRLAGRGAAARYMSCGLRVPRPLSGRSEARRVRRRDRELDARCPGQSRPGGRRCPIAGRGPGCRDAFRIDGQRWSCRRHARRRERRRGRGSSRDRGRRGGQGAKVKKAAKDEASSTSRVGFTATGGQCPNGKVTYPPAKTDNRPAHPSGLPDDAPYVRPTVATIDLNAASKVPDFPSGHASGSPGRVFYSGETAVVERLSNGVIPSAVVRTEAGKTRQVRTIDLEPIAQAGARGLTARGLPHEGGRHHTPFSRPTPPDALSAADRPSLSVMTMTRSRPPRPPEYARVGPGSLSACPPSGKAPTARDALHRTGRLRRGLPPQQHVRRYRRVERCLDHGERPRPARGLVKRAMELPVRSVGVPASSLSASSAMARSTIVWRPSARRRSSGSIASRRAKTSSASDFVSARTIAPRFGSNVAVRLRPAAEGLPHRDLADA